MQRQQKPVRPVSIGSRIREHRLGATFPVSAAQEKGTLQASRRDAMNHRRARLIPQGVSGTAQALTEFGPLHAGRSMQTFAQKGRNRTNAAQCLYLHRKVAGAET